MAQVKNVARGVRDLNDGRVLAPGQSASSVDVKDPHNARLIEAGDLEVRKPAARKRRTANTPDQED